MMTGNKHERHDHEEHDFILFKYMFSYFLITVFYNMCNFYFICNIRYIFCLMQ